MVECFSEFTTAVDSLSQRSSRSTKTATDRQRQTHELTWNQTCWRQRLSEVECEPAGSVTNRPHTHTHTHTYWLHRHVYDRLVRWQQTIDRSHDGSQDTAVLTGHRYGISLPAFIQLSCLSTEDGQVELTWVADSNSYQSQFYKVHWDQQTNSMTSSQAASFEWQSPSIMWNAEASTSRGNTNYMMKT